LVTLNVGKALIYPLTVVVKTLRI